MKYEIRGNQIEIFGKEDFDVKHILECGQIFNYKDGVVYSGDQRAEIVETETGFLILCTNAKYFENFFDLKTDYGKIKEELSRYEVLKDAINFGHGIRILKNDLFEVLISFIISANNNIKRIQLILSRLVDRLGKDMGLYKAFPTYEALKSVPESFFKEIGCGYRAKYLYKVLRQIDPKTLESYRSLSTKELQKKLISLSGVGPKVADCIMLFGYSRMDVFPVDTWIFKVYNTYFKREDNKNRIREQLNDMFKDKSGYAQQYLFFYERSSKI